MTARIFNIVAAKIMRHVLVDHTRSKNRQKRGSGAEKVPLDGIALSDPKADTGLLELDEALDQLARLSERKAEIIELHCFGGLNYEEIAAALNISSATVHRELQMGKAWLHEKLFT